MISLTNGYVAIVVVEDGHFQRSKSGKQYVWNNVMV